jgi:hypothetical protein
MRNTGNMQQTRRLCYVLARNIFACERIILQDRSNRLNAGIPLLYKGDQLRALAGIPERIVKEKDTHGEGAALRPFDWAEWRCGGCLSDCGARSKPSWTRHSEKD